MLSGTEVSSTLEQFVRNCRVFGFQKHEHSVNKCKTFTNLVRYTTKHKHFNTHSHGGIAIAIKLQFISLSDANATYPEMHRASSVKRQQEQEQHCQIGSIGIHCDA